MYDPVMTCIMITTAIHLNSAESVSRILDELKQNYVKSDPPPADETTTELKIGIHVKTMALDSATTSYVTQLYLQQQWNDPRLRFDPDRIQGDQALLPEGSHDVIWTPDTFFRSAREFYVGNHLLKLKPDGEVWYVQQVFATFECPMDFQQFPFDTQNCSMKFESFAYQMDTLYFSWLPNPVQLDTNLELSRYTISDVTLDDCSQNYTTGVKKIFSASSHLLIHNIMRANKQQSTVKAFPCLEAVFVLSRDSEYFISQVYLPYLLVVVISWLALWIRLEYVTARAAISLGCCFAVSAHTIGVNESIMMSTVKAIDIWMLACVLFSVLAFLQLPLALAWNPIIPQQVSSKCGEQGQTKTCHLSNIFDLVFKIAFPCLFILFNIIYWSLYCG